MACGAFNCRKKRKKNRYNLAGIVSMTYSGNAILQSKVPNSTKIEDMDAELVSNNAAGCSEKMLCKQKPSRR